MHKEYTIDPAILSSFDRVRAILGACGWHKGKVACEYPKKGWKRKVYDACVVSGDREKKALEEALQSHPFCRRKNVSPYNKDISWLDSAKTEHTRMAFAAILSDCSVPSEQIIDGRYITEQNEPLWAPPSGISPRTSNDFANAISLLAKNSSRVIFVDPHFDFAAPRYTDSFTAMLERLISDAYKRPPAENDSMSNPTIELHLRVKRSQGNTDSYESIASRLRHNIERQLPRHIPAGLEVVVHLWKEHDEPAERLHNRYFLTDLGGFSFGIGLDISTADDGQPVQNDDITVLSKEQHEKHLDEYRSDSSCFKSLGVFAVAG